jgi:hypothetical protein
MWIEAVASTGGDSRGVLASVHHAGCTELLHYLTGEHHRTVLIWMDGVTIRIQVIPRRMADGCMSAPGAMSYSGTSFPTILRAAYIDAVRLAQPNPRWIGSVKEVSQWVP